MKKNRTRFTLPLSDRIENRARRKSEKTARKIGFDENRNYHLYTETHDFLSPFFPVERVLSAAEEGAEERDRGGFLSEKGIFVGTIRMGYGHIRMGIALASAAASMGYTPYWFDLLSFDTPGADMIRNMEGWYSRGSKIANRIPLFNRLWEYGTGRVFRPIHKQVINQQIAGVLTDIFNNLPRTMPFLGTHPWVSQAAVFAGMEHVVNTINDNWNNGVFLVSGARQVVQGPSMFMGYRLTRGMGRGRRESVPLSPELIKVVGHYIDHEIVSNIPADCDDRIARMKGKEPRRFLVSIGGAGAQEDLYLKMIKSLLPAVEGEKAALLINFGDHGTVLERIFSQLPLLREKAVLHSRWEETVAFSESIGRGRCEGIHIFLHEDVFPAVYTTNLLMRRSDFLVTKPGELAFYPVPKLNIKRIGAHEEWNAVRSAELGDGTPELTDWPLILKALKTSIEQEDLLETMCANIGRNHSIGVYNGAYEAVRTLMER